jgi:hypothetical protein
MGGGHLAILRSGFIATKESEVAAGDIVPVPGAQFEATLASASPDVPREFAQRMMDADVVRHASDQAKTPRARGPGRACDTGPIQVSGQRRPRTAPRTVYPLVSIVRLGWEDSAVKPLPESKVFEGASYLSSKKIL